MTDRHPIANWEFFQSRFVVNLTRSISRVRDEESAIVSLKYICTLFDTVFKRRKNYFAMNLVLVGDLIPCICMSWKMTPSYWYWAIRVLNKVIMEFPPTKERLVNNGAFTNVLLSSATFAVREDEKGAMELMKLFSMVLIDDNPNILSSWEVRKCIDVVFMLLKEWPVYLRLHMIAYDILIWTCHKYGYSENHIRRNRHRCLVLRKLRHYLRAEGARLLERADGLLSSDKKNYLKNEFHCAATGVPRFRLNYYALRIGYRDLIVEERKTALYILTLAIWDSKIEAIYTEEPNKKRRRTRQHLETTREIAWQSCQSTFILKQVLHFLSPPV
jgi:hypothetical protein